MGGRDCCAILPAIGKIFEAVRAAVKIPFTVKFRAGWSDEEIVCVELARMAEDCGLAAVALHARTREQGYSGNARWEWIAAVKDAVKIPVIGNGDIRIAGGRVRDGDADGMRRGDDWADGAVESVDFSADSASIARAWSLDEVGSRNGLRPPRTGASGAPRFGLPQNSMISLSEGDRYEMIRTYFSDVD